MGKKKQYPEVEKLLALIEERKAKGITPKNKGKKVTKSKEVIKNSKNLKASQMKTDLIVPDGECVYVGFTESHECTGKMVGSLLRSDKILVYKGKVFSKNIKQCVRCKKYFISPKEFYSKDNIPENYQFIEEDNGIKSISPKEFIIRVNTNQCTFGNHRLRDIRCSIPISPISGGAKRIEVLAAYCYMCDTYFILEEEYLKVKKAGKILCGIYDNEEYFAGLYKDRDNFELNEESLLHRMGYNVSTRENLSCEKRWYILESAVDFDILTRTQICSHLDYLIHRSYGRKNYADAISKWECDRNHISNYCCKELETVMAESLARKSYRH